MSGIHEIRRDRARQALAAAGADAGLITNGVNVRYLTGLVSSNAALLLTTDGQAVLSTDSRYAGTAERECSDVELLVERNVEVELVLRALADGRSVIGFEDSEMTVSRHEALLLVSQPAELLPLGESIDELRIVKDSVELELLERACGITGEAFSAVLDWLRPGVSEREFAVALERAMVDFGAEAPAFDTIVASGPNGAIPHHVPGARQFEAGDLVTIDCGARYGGYHADMTRTVAIGEPAAWQRDIYRVVAEAQAQGVAASVVGADVAEVDGAARDLIADAGYGENFSHGVGHGVGLLIHEPPWLGVGKTGTLQDRVPITIEPGIYLPGAGGVRIEDTLVVRAGTGAAGSAQSLTTITRELLVL
jgi:Xaa-Pro aminopeptidase